MNNLSNLINKKTLTLILLSGFFATAHAAGLDDFIITVQTDNPGPSSDVEFTIPTSGGGYNYNVDCNDDGIDEFTAEAGDVTCDYSALGGAGSYRIRIEDNTGAGTGFPRIFFDFSGDREKITGINQWGTGQWTSMANAFEGCSNLNDAGGAAADVPDLSTVTDMDRMFSNASTFNQDISSWTTASVTDMSGMFRNTSAFNQDISSWDTASVTRMEGMFNNASAFNQSISSWDTASVTGMFFMFSGANVFNQDISSWDTASVTDMSGMFANASTFNQNLGAWDVTALTSAGDMFANIALSTANYDALLIGWDAQALQPGVAFSGGNSTYCDAEVARANMIAAPDSWVITDAGLDCGDDFIITVQTDNPGTSSDTEFTIPTTGAGYDYNVDCNDDGIDEFTAQAGDVTCDYSALGGAGTYRIRIEDNTGAGTGFPRIFFNDGGDAEKITGINQWGTGQWTSMANAFEGCSNLNDVGGAATDVPDLSAVTDMSFMFRSASIFNQDIGGWDTASVMDMSFMFANTGAFNQDINSWNTVSVTKMSGMFNSASTFNQDISSWDTSSVTDMNGMFEVANTFNQNIGSWDTANVTNMSFMFSNVNAFNQNLGAWDVTSLTSAGNMFQNIALSTTNYDALLIGWDAQALQSNVIFSGGNSTYCNAEAARANMIAAPDSWVITDAGLDCSGVVMAELSTTNATDLEATGGNLPVILINGTIVAASTVTISDTAAGTATSGVDFIAFGSPLVVNIPAGIYDGTIGTAIAIPTLAIIDDALVEADETIILDLSAATGDLSLGDANGDAATNTIHTYTITNDDGAGAAVIIPTLSWYTLLLLLLALILTSRVYIRRL